MTKPLEGIRVLDLSTFVAAPVAARLLADMGAEVIKIERPEGDMWRHSSSMAIPGRYSLDENPVFDIYNAGKRMIALDMKTPAGQEIFHKLLARSDVFITNNREKALKRLGASYDDLKQRYPRLIYAQVTGFGTKGPDADTPAFDVTAFWARSGFLRDSAVIGEDGSYNPTTPPSGAGDSVTAYLLLAQIVAALYQRAQTGQGQRVESSLFHTGVFTFGTMIINGQEPWGRVLPKPRPELGLPGGCYKCADGDFIFIANSMIERLMGQLSVALNRPDFQTDPRFSTPAARVAHKQELYDFVSGEIIKKPVAEWLAIFQKVDIPAMRYGHYRDVAKDEQAWANGYLEHVTFRSGNTDVMPASPLHMETVTDLKTVPAPLCGGDTSRILRELGCGEEEIARLIREGVVKQS